MRKSSNSKAKFRQPGKATRASRRIKVNSDIFKQSRTNILGIPVQQIYKQAQLCYEILFKLCQYLYLIPFERDAETGDIIPGCWKRRSVYNFIVFIRFLNALYKLRIVTNLLSEGNIGIKTLMCVCAVLVDLNTCAFTAAATLRPEETVDMLNSWKSISDILEDMETEKSSPFNDLHCCVVDLIIIAVIGGVIASVSISFFLFPSMEIFWFNHLDSWGLFPPTLLPKWIWRLLFLPVEMVPYITNVCASGYNALIAFVGFAVAKVFALRIRTLSIRKLADRQMVEQLCVTFAVENKIMCAWLVYFMPPVLFIMFLTIIVTLYIALAHTYLPLYIYVFFPFFGIVLMGSLFVISFDEVLIVQSVDSVKESLLNSSAGHIRGLTREMRINAMKRAGALQPVSHPIGGFGKYSLNVPIIIWEEVINQLLFLLSF